MRSTLVAALLLSASLPAAAVTATVTKGPVEARSLEIAGFAGELAVGVTTGSGITMRLEAPDKVVAAMSVQTTPERMHVGFAPVDGGTTVVRGPVTATAKGGGSASVEIGGRVQGSDEPSVLRLEVPAGTRLVLRDLTGLARVADIRAPFDLELTAGTVEAGSVGPATLAIKGSGTVKVAEVKGDLTMHLDGGGSMAVAAGEASSVDAAIKGSGNLRFLGRAQSARARIDGAGTIELADVATEPDIRVNGAGSVRVNGR